MGKAVLAGAFLAIDTKLDFAAPWKRGDGRTDL